MIRTLDEIVETARERGPYVMAVANAQDDAVLEAVRIAADKGLIRPVLIGDEKQIRDIAMTAGIELGDLEIVHEPDKKEACERAAAMVSEGSAQFLMKGFVDTSAVMRAVLRPEYGLKGRDPISHVAVMEVPGFDRLLLVADSAMIIAPTMEEKAAIIRNSVAVAHALGNAVPNVAVLCAVEKENPKMPCTLDAAALSAMCRNGEIPGCHVDGPLALDNAVSEDAARHKGIRSEVAGHADILIAPDIEAGNILNKSLEYFAHAKKAGVMMGAKAPIVLISRASPAQSKMYSIALGCLIIEQKRGT